MNCNDKYISVEGHPDLVKDKKSGAVLNIDNNALENYKRKRSEKMLNDKRMNKMENDISSLKNLLHELIQEIRK